MTHRHRLQPALGRASAALFALLLLPVPGLAHSRPQAAGGAAPPVIEDVASALRALELEESARFEAAWQFLVDAGLPAAEAALADWSEAGTTARVVRARLLDELAQHLAEGAQGAAGGAGRLGRLLAPELTPEPAARAALARALGSPALAREGIERLSELAAEDLDRGVRAAALAALADAAEPAAAIALDALLVRLPDDERPGAARALAKLPAARGRVVRRVQQAVLHMESNAPGEPEVEAVRHHATLAALAGGYGRALAELPAGGEDRADRAPFLLLRVHPSSPVRAAGQRALDRFLLRLVELGEEERAEAVLELFARDGLAPREVLYRRARLALAGLGDPDASLSLAGELLRATAGAESASDRGWRHYGLVLRGASLFALGRYGEARAAFKEAAGVLRGLIAEREDLRPSLYAAGDHPIAPVGGALVVDRIVELGLVEVWLSLCALAEGQPVEAATVLEPLRRAHVLVLGAQLHGQRTDSVFDARSLDDFLERDLGPRRLLLVSRELPGGKEGRFLDLQLLLGRALATVVPQEIMGFERADVAEPALQDVFLDDERFALMTAIAFAERDAAQRAWFARLTELDARVAREDDPSYRTQDYFLEDAEYRRLLGLMQRERDASQVRQRATQDERKDPSQRARLHPELRELRTPSLYALTLAGELRADGRSAESRELAQRMLSDLRTSTGQSVLWQEWISARLELAIASAWMDEDRPREAERAGLEAVRRLEALERSMEEMLARAADDPARAIGIRRQQRQTELLRADALLSLAVNANVRGKDPERALRFFERAFEIDQREFMRVLLACYRARSGRHDEARAVLRGVQPSPSLYYNLACTHALLGDVDESIEYLRRELEENQPTPGALARQRAWAREDPDLSALRGDPRFERLTATPDEQGGR